MSEWIKPTLSKGVIIEDKKNGEYIVKDIFNNKEILISMTGKERMIYKYKKGDIVYFAESILRPEKGKLMTPTGLKYNTYLFSLKSDVDEKTKNLK